MKTSFKSRLVFISAQLLFIVLFFSCEKNNAPFESMNQDLNEENGLSTKILDSGSDVDWSPDGSCLAYTYYSPDYNIFIASDSGLNPRQVTIDTCVDWKPSFSPDGNRIAFSSNRGDTGNFKIFIIDTNGSNLRKITPDSIYIQGYDWSPDGSTIVFDTGGGLRSVDVTSGQITKLTSGSYTGWPKYSPDGTKIAVESDQDRVKLQVWTYNNDGTNPKQITQNGGEFPCWSPDGQWIAYSKKVSTNYDIWIIPANGGNEIQITNTSDNELRPAWCPDGNRIAYDTHLYPSNPGIWIIPIEILE